MTGLILPVTLDGDRIKLTQNYGDDFAWKGYSQYYRQYYGLDGHNGIDVGGWGIDGERVNAAGDGTVVFAGTGDYWDSTVGGGSFTIVIHHPHLGVWTAYLHLRNNSNTVKAGQKVKQGQMIARAGNTGIGTGAHLHFQVMPVAPLPLVYQPNWGCVNPRPYMQRVSAASESTITPIKTGFEQLMEQIMNWYENKTDFQSDMRRIAKLGAADAAKDIASAVWGWMIESRWKLSLGKKYRADTYIGVNNAKGHGTENLLLDVVETLGELVSRQDLTAEQLRTQLSEKLGNLRIQVVELEDSPTDISNKENK